MLLILLLAYRIKYCALAIKTTVIDKIYDPRQNIFNQNHFHWKLYLKKKKLRMAHGYETALKKK